MVPCIIANPHVLCSLFPRFTSESCLFLAKSAYFALQTTSIRAIIYADVFTKEGKAMYSPCDLHEAIKKTLRDSQSSIWPFLLHQLHKSESGNFGSAYIEVAVRPRVLLVEDDKICQFVHSKLLQQFGCEVDLAEDGEQALVMFNNNYDTIVLDVDLPGISGIEVSKVIRNQLEGKYVPIIGLTVSDDTVKRQCLAAGYDEVASKPTNPKEFGAILQYYLPIERL